MKTEGHERTEIEWERYDSRARIFSDKRSIVRGLLAHDDFEAEQVLESDGEAIAVEGMIPVACLLVKGYPRKNGAHGGVVSNYVYKDDEEKAASCTSKARREKRSDESNTKDEQQADDE